MSTDRMTFPADLFHHGGGPLGDVGLVSRRTKAGISAGLREAALNLLRKAVRAIARGDDDAARGLATRAVLLPYDDHEDVRPGWHMAFTLLFDAFVDAVEAADAEWLDRALALLDASTGHAAAAVARALAVIADDWGLEPHEERRVRAATRDLDPGEWHSVQPPAGEAEQVAAVLDLLRLVVAYGAR